MAATFRVKVNFGLGSLALIAFVVSFFLARLFTTLNPDTVVVSGGIHFHHFWYGLAMVVISGWLGIVSFHPTLNRLYATVFGFGGGLIADEVGLLLTLGNYHSELTYVFFIAFICFVTSAILVFRYRRSIGRDLEEMSRGETVVHIGVYTACFSALFFSFDIITAGLGTALVGILIALSGFVLHRKAQPG